MTTRILVGILMIVVWCSHAGAQDTVRLRAFIRAEKGQKITLADVAELRGESTGGLGGIVLIDSLGAQSNIDITIVRDALRKNNVNLGRLLLSGAPCELRGAGAPAAKSESAASDAKADDEEMAVSAAGLSAPDVRTAIAAKLAELYGVAPDHLRLAFERGQDELLSAQTAGRAVAVQPAAGGRRVPVQVRIYSGDRLERSGTVRVGIEVLREVLVTSAPVQRGEALSQDVVTTDERWLSPEVKPARYEDAIGANALAKIESGAIVEARAVRPPDCINKGDICQVDCVGRGVAVQGQGRALEAGREGQVIRFQSMHSKKIFKARVSGEGRAVMEAGGR